MQSSRDKVNKISEIYQLIANKNPNQLRLLIPSKEIWRFFIDGRLQKSGRQLSNNRIFQQQSMFDSFFSPDHLKYTIAEYMEKVERISYADKSSHCKSAIMQLLKKKFWCLNDAEYQQLQLIDLLSMDQAWLPFERKEPGYLKAVCAGFQLIFDTTQPLTTDFIKRLHEVATNNVQNIACDQNDLESKKGNFRCLTAAAFQLGDINMSKAGLHQLIERMNANYSISKKQERYLCKKLSETSGLRIDGNFLQVIRALSTQAESAEIDFFAVFKKFGRGLNGDEKMKSVVDAIPLIKKLIQAQRDNALVSCLYEDIKLSSAYFFVSDQSYNTNRKLDNAMKTLIAHYESKINASHEYINKLNTIVEFVQSCEQLHPFYDGNCRTFCMLLLNHLLMKNGFPPAILLDPNRFDLYSRDELLLELIDGMTNTLYLLDAGMLYNVKTDDVISYIGSKDILRPVASYFNEIVAVEEETRKRMQVQHAI